MNICCDFFFSHSFFRVFFFRLQTFVFFGKKRLRLTHACACFGGWSGAIEAGWRDSNGMPTVRRTPDGVRDSCINGIFDDALSLDSISSRSICKRKQQRKLKHIDHDCEIAKFKRIHEATKKRIPELSKNSFLPCTRHDGPKACQASYRKFRWMRSQGNRRNIWLCIIDECHARYLCIAVCIAVALV